MIDNILTEFPSASFYICGEFNIGHQECLVHVIKTNEEGKYFLETSPSSLAQIIERPTYAFDVTRYQANLLDHFLTSCPEKYLEKILLAPWTLQPIP